jgi:hypothetical protein
LGGRLRGDSGAAYGIAARSFFARESFLLFPDQPLRLFRPMAGIATLFRRETAPECDNAVPHDNRKPEAI